MAFKRSAVRSRLSPPQITPTFVRKPVFFLLSGLVVVGARLFIYHFSTTLPSKLLSQGVCHIRFSGRVQVSVDIGGHLDVSMVQPLLHVLQGPAHGDEHTGATVPKFVEADVGEAVGLQQLVVAVADVVRGKRKGNFRLENCRFLCASRRAFLYTSIYPNLLK